MEEISEFMEKFSGCMEKISGFVGIWCRFGLDC